MSELGVQPSATGYANGLQSASPPGDPPKMVLDQGQSGRAGIRASSRVAEAKAAYGIASLSISRIR